MAGTLCRLSAGRGCFTESRGARRAPPPPPPAPHPPPHSFPSRSFLRRRIFCALVMPSMSRAAGAAGGGGGRAARGGGGGGLGTNGGGRRCRRALPDTARARVPGASRAPQRRHHRGRPRTGGRAGAARDTPAAPLGAPHRRPVPRQARHGRQRPRGRARGRGPGRRWRAAARARRRAAAGGRRRRAPGRARCGTRRESRCAGGWGKGGVSARAVGDRRRRASPPRGLPPLFLHAPHTSAAAPAAGAQRGAAAGAG